MYKVYPFPRDLFVFKNWKASYKAQLQVINFILNHVSKTINELYSPPPLIIFSHIHVLRLKNIVKNIMRYHYQND